METVEHEAQDALMWDLIAEIQGLRDEVRGLIDTLTGVIADRAA